MRSWRSRCSAVWSYCGPPLGVGAVAALVGLVASNECNRYQVAAWDRGFASGVEAALGAESPRWGLCLERGREFRCAKTSEGRLIEVRVP